MIKKIGLFGGTFDPIHNGHLNLAFELMEHKQLDEVWFIPAYLNPLKVDQPMQTLVEHRLNMLTLTLSGIPQFKIKTLECERAEPSYTIDTIERLMQEDSLNEEPSQFFLLMGEDTIGSFPNWRLPEKILERVTLVIGSRVAELPNEFLNCSEPIWQAFQKGLTMTRLFDISSTDIRKRLAAKLYCKHLLPEKVIDYIQKNQLY